jgi:hypothetical protein
LNDKDALNDMAEHRDAHMGSQAIHLAAATGNRLLIEMLMIEFGGDPWEKTLGLQTVMHCAAQRYEGVLSIFIFSRQHRISVRQQDSKGATALHFATISLHAQNVQALIKLGADPNAQDIDGNTCLHLCIKQMIEIRITQDKNAERAASHESFNPGIEDDTLNEEGFEILKNIAKELLFSGAMRNIRNYDGNTALCLLNDHGDLFSSSELIKMRYILSKPKRCQWLRLTRPIEKVHRTNVT